jgi:hypothetical protein
MKASSGHLYLYNGEPLENLAWDFIAELFERDHNSSFVVLTDVFSASDWDVVSTEEVEQQFRRIVCTKVDDNIFRSIGEKDPSLKKIIRNLKNAAQNTKFENNVVVENGFVTVMNEIPEEQRLPLIPSEVLEIQLSHRIRETMQMPEVLLEVVSILEENQLYQKKISLVAVAISIRKAFVHIRDKGQEYSLGSEPEENLHCQSFEKRIEAAADNIKRSLGEKYVKKRVLTQQKLSLFMDAVKEIIRLEFIEKHSDTNHFECLKQHNPEIEYDEYREQYRPVFEYLVKKTRAEIIEFYEKEWR